MVHKNSAGKYLGGPGANWQCAPIFVILNYFNPDHTWH